MIVVLVWTVFEATSIADYPEEVRQAVLHPEVPVYFILSERAVYAEGKYWHFQKITRCINIEAFVFLPYESRNGVHNSFSWGEMARVVVYC